MTRHGQGQERRRSFRARQHQQNSGPEHGLEPPFCPAKPSSSRYTLPPLEDGPPLARSLQDDPQKSAGLAGRAAPLSHSTMSDLWNALTGENVLEGLNIPSVVLNLVLTLVLGQLLSFHYRVFAQVLSNKRKFAPTLVFIAATTMLVISVVKTSLALSLGLVGALSIIRFRTPIKEPEELAYLFLAVALGVGMGADQRVATAVMFFGILLFLALAKKGGLREESTRTLLHINTSLGDSNREGILKRLLDEIAPHAAGIDLRRVDAHEDMFDATLSVDLVGADSIGPLLDSVQVAFPGAAVSLIEADTLD